MNQLRGHLVSYGVQLTIREIGLGGFSTEGPIAFEPGGRHVFRFVTEALRFEGDDKSNRAADV